MESLGGNILLSPRREENNCKWVLDFGCGLDALVSRSLYERRETYRIAAVDFRNVGFASDLTGFYFVNAPMRSLEVLAEDQKFFHDNLMDLIVSRLLVPGMTDFKAYISQAFTMLKPGAYLEIQELEFAWMSRKCRHLSPESDLCLHPLVCPAICLGRTRSHFTLSQLYTFQAVSFFQTILTFLLLHAPTFPIGRKTSIPPQSLSFHPSLNPSY